jgi:hypothetical protein
MDAGDQNMFTGISGAQYGTLEPTAAEQSAGDAGSASTEQGPPHFLAGIDDDVTADLRAIGIELTPDVERAIDDPHREAMAAMLLRRAGGIARELAATQAAMDLELRAIREHYERAMAPLRTHYTRVIGFVQTLAEITEWTSKKSRVTPFGSYGVKDSRATVECTDRAAVTAWAIGERPDVVRVVATLPLTDARERFSDSEIAAQKTEVEWGKLKPTLDVEGQLPPGVVRVEAKREAFATPTATPITREG